MNFHPMGGLTEQEKRQRPNTREFKGDGTPYLPVPGLISLAPGDGAVRVGTLELPANLTYQVAVDATLQNLETRVEPTVVVRHAPDGTPVLLRNVRSNDGFWQPGMSVFVDGEWDEEVPAPDPQAPVADALEAMRAELEHLRASNSSQQSSSEVTDALAEMRAELERLRQSAQQAASEPASELNFSAVKGAEQGKEAQKEREKQALQKEQKAGG